MYTERIRKMREDGLLDDAQAKALEDSLSPLASAGLRPARSAFAAKLILLACVVLALLAVSAIFIYVPEGGAPVAEIQDVRETLNVPGGTGSMNRPLSTLTSVALLLLPLALIIAAFAWFYNGIVEKEERVFEAWSQVESNLQRRADLVPNLVETVSRYMKHERETLAGVTDQRADALNPLADAMDRLIKDQQIATQEKGIALEDENALARLAEAQQTLGGSLKHLIAVAESYPNLRSGDQFLTLQAHSKARRTASTSRAWTSTAPWATTTAPSGACPERSSPASATSNARPTSRPRRTRRSLSR
jgi:LemA protein